MSCVTREDIKDAAERLGIKKEDSVIIHSSMKSLGYVEGGADAVIDGFLDAVGNSGTVIFPTLCQKDWEHVYETWHMDKDSDVGLISNVARKRKDAYRSNQATHSVAAIGKDAEYITKTHGESGKREGIFGGTPFSKDSPWEKMYNMNTKIVFLGVGMLYATFRHYAEYVYVDDSLEKIKHLPEYEKMKNALWYYGKDELIWPHIENEPICTYLKELGKVTETKCGNATLLCVDSKLFVDFCIKVMENADERFLWDLKIYYKETMDWLNKIEALKGNR